MSNLKEILIEEIRLQGPVTFARFMEQALYHTEYGYYSTPTVKIGRQGDFYTAPTVSPLFGAMLARQLEEMWRVAGRPKIWPIVECGPGTGKMAGDIMNAIIKNHHDFYQAVVYYLLEISPALKEQQQQELASHEAGAQFRWLGNLTEINPEGFEGCILANELVDAFPVHLVKYNNGWLHELYVGLDANDNFHFVEGKLSTVELAEYFHMQGIELDEGQQAEVNLRVAVWLRQVAASLNRGFVMLIDYGATAKDLYGPHRFNGTLRCFHKHKLVVNPLVNVGSQDITAHVNFTALAIQGRNAGFEFLGLVSQPQFLLNLGIMDTIKEHNDFTYNPEVMKKTMAIKQLVLPGGMGEIFKVLVFSRNVVPPPQLTGLTGICKPG